MTNTEWLRKRLLEAAGVFDPPPQAAPTLEQIYKMQWSGRFERLMRNRMAMGYFRYGSLEKQISKPKFDNIGSIEKRLAKYRQTKNREMLVDIANLCLVEFVVHPEYPFAPQDDAEHAQEL